MQKKKHAKKFSIKYIGAPKTPPPRNSLCRPSSCILKGKRGPKQKEFAGRGVPWGGVLGGRVLAKLFIGETGLYANGVGRIYPDFNWILTGLYFLTPVGVRLVPLKTHDFKGF